MDVEKTQRGRRVILSYYYRFHRESRTGRKHFFFHYLSFPLRNDCFFTEARNGDKSAGYEFFQGTFFGRQVKGPSIISEISCAIDKSSAPVISILSPVRQNKIKKKNPTFFTLDKWSVRIGIANYKKCRSIMRVTKEESHSRIGAPSPIGRADFFCFNMRREDTRSESENG